MSELVIRRLIEMRVDDYASSNGYRVAYQNVDFTPSNDIHLEVYLLPAQKRSETLDGTHKLYAGVVQINVVIPNGIGTRDAQVICDEVEAIFPNSLRMTDAETGLIVQVASPPGVGPSLPRDGKCVMPISFRYRMDKI